MSDFKDNLLPAETDIIVQKTLQAYEQIAENFAERYFNANLEEEVEHFCRWLPRGARVVDLGCGVGRDLLKLSAYGLRTVGLDLSPAMLRHAVLRGVSAPLVLGDLRTLPLATASCDGSWACASLLHFPKSALATILGEIRRITERVAFFSLIEGGGERWSFEKSSTKRFFCYYRMDELLVYLRSTGFKEVDVWIKDGEGASPVRWLNVIAKTV